MLLKVQVRSKASSDHWGCRKRQSQSKGWGCSCYPAALSSPGMGKEAPQCPGLLLQTRFQQQMMIKVMMMMMISQPWPPGWQAARLPQAAQGLAGAWPPWQRAFPPCTHPTPTHCHQMQQETQLAAKKVKRGLTRKKRENHLLERDHQADTGVLFGAEIWPSFQCPRWYLFLTTGHPIWLRESPGCVPFPALCVPPANPPVPAKITWLPSEVCASHPPQSRAYLQCHHGTHRPLDIWGLKTRPHFILCKALSAELPSLPARDRRV